MIFFLPFQWAGGWIVLRKRKHTMSMCERQTRQRVWSPFSQVLMSSLCLREAWKETNKIQVLFYSGVYSVSLGENFNFSEILSFGNCLQNESLSLKMNRYLWNHLRLLWTCPSIPPGKSIFVTRAEGKEFMSKNVLCQLRSHKKFATGRIQYMCLYMFG